MKGLIVRRPRIGVTMAVTALAVCLAYAGVGLAANVKLELHDDGALVSGATFKYSTYAGGGYVPIPSNPFPVAEDDWYFHCTYNGTSVLSGKVTVSADMTYTFQAYDVTLELRDDGGLVSGATFRFSNWPGGYDLAPSSALLLLPDDWYFHCTYNGTSVLSGKVTVSADMTYTFQAYDVTLELRDDGGLVSGATFKFSDYAGGYDLALSSALLLLPDDWYFHCTYNGTSVLSGKVTVSADMTYTFQAYDVELQLWDGGVNETGSTTFKFSDYAGGYDPIPSNPLLLLPDAWWFWASFADGTQVKSLTISADDVVRFDTTPVNIRFSGTITYRLGTSGGWNAFTSNGLLPGTYQFQFDSKHTTSITVGTSPINKTAVVLTLKDSAGDPLAGGKARVKDTYWHFVTGVTDAFGKLFELRDGASSSLLYEMKYNNTTQLINQDPGSNSYYDFQTAKAAVKLIDMDDNPLSGGVVSYGVSGGSQWSWPGAATNTVGYTFAELFPGDYYFKMAYGGGSYTMPGKQNISSDVVFQTGRLRWDGTCPEPYRVYGAARFFSDGMDLLPGNCEVDFTGASLNKVFVMVAGAETWTSDKELPTITAPKDETVECIGDVPAAETDVTAFLALPDTALNDNCTVDANLVIEHVGDVSDGNSCPEVITRTYRVQDECFNWSSTDVQLITVDDTTAPTITAPKDETVECIGDVPAAETDVTAFLALPDTALNDNCTVDANLVIEHVGDVSDGNSCPEVITRTYRVQDECFNWSSTDVQLITVDDTTAPTITAPKDETVECIGDVPAAETDVTAFLALPDTALNDNCTVDANLVIEHVGDVSDGNSCPEVITRTYRVQDECFNWSSTDVQLITVDDTTAPTITAPKDETVECIGDVPAAETDVTAFLALPDTALNDNCTVDANLVIEHVGDVSDGNSCPEVITRTYRVQDECFNWSSTDVQLITVDDTTAPTITAPKDETVECIGDVPAAETDVTAFLALPDTALNDNCTVDANLVIEHVGDVSDGNSCPEVITRTYRVQDECFNWSSTDVQLITVDDTTAPTITAPKDETVECIGDVPAAETDVTAFLALPDTALNDNCTVDANLVIEHVGDVSDGNSCPEVITRTYRVQDECFNWSSTDVQLITVDDTTAPTITAPKDETVECIGDVPAAETDVTAFLALPDTALNDNCTVDANLVIEHVGDVSDGNSCPEVITRTYRVQDECFNWSSTDVQLITVDDTTAPTITAPKDETVECIGDVPAAETDVTAFLALPDTALNDNCTVDANLVIEHVGDVSDGNSCPEVITRTYRVQDECFNWSSTDVQLITVDDTTAPTITAPKDETVECIGDVPAAETDVTAFLALPDTALNDNCTVDANLVIEHVGDVSDGNSCPEVITRTYRVQDECFNWSSTDVQLITVDDTTAPTITAPKDETVECIGDVPAAETDVTAFLALPDTALNDNCTVDANLVIEHVGDVSDGNSCPEVITRTYRVQDECFNWSSTDVQLITVDDTTAPTITAPKDETVECIGDVPAAETDVTAFLALPDTALNDNCTVDANLVIEHVGDVSDGNSCPEVITRTYRVQDECFNWSSTDVQLITVDDTTAPTITAPKDETVECIGDVPAAETDVTAFLALPDTALNDNCTVDANLVIEHVGDVSDGNSCPEVITRTYRVQDECFNWSSTDVQLITVDDTTAPTITAPKDETVECIGDVPAAETDVTAFLALPDTALNDNCTVDANLVIEHVGDVSDGNSCPEVITRTYRVQDECFNWSSTDVQLITVDDTTAPTITAPKDETVECIGDVPAAETDVTAFLALPDTALNDNCTVDANLVIEHVGDVSDGNSCPEVITRTYRVQDECFNWSSTDVQLITVDDTTAPTFTRPADTTIYKDASCAYDADPTITGDVTDEDDNCDTSLVATYVDVVAAGSCEGEQIITRTWSLVDDCGNAAADQDQTITVVDTTAPAISDCPSNITQDNDPGVCGAIVTWVEPTAGDNCDPAPALVSTHSPGDYFPVGTTTITYTATDDCGNFSTCLFDVTVLDVEPPTAEFLTAPPNPDYDTRPLFEWTAEDNNDCTAPPELQYRRRLDGGVWTGWSLATSDILGPLSEDWHTFEVEARDEAGNVSIPIIHTWYRATYDVTPPVLPDEDIVGGGGAVGSVAAPGCFFDLEHCLEGGGGEIEGVPLNAVFEVGEPITIQFVVTDVDGELVFDAVAAATFGDITLVDGEEVYAIIGYFHIPYVLELDLYSLLVLTVGEEDDVLALPAGNYIVWIDLNDGTHIEQRIQIVDPIG